MLYLYLVSAINIVPWKHKKFTTYSSAKHARSYTSTIEDDGTFWPHHSYVMYFGEATTFIDYDHVSFKFEEFVGHSGLQDVDGRINHITIFHLPKHAICKLQ